jgi:hypothetical protein
MKPVTDHLYEVDGYHHGLDDALRRIAPAFRRVVIDRDRGDEWIRRGYEQLGELNAPDVIRESHLSMVGRTAHVSISDGSGCAEFFITGGEDIGIEYDSIEHRAACREIASKLAEVLGYALADKLEPPVIR